MKKLLPLIILIGFPIVTETHPGIVLMLIAVRENVIDTLDVHTVKKKILLNLILKRFVQRERNVIHLKTTVTPLLDFSGVKCDGYAFNFSTPDTHNKHDDISIKVDVYWDTDAGKRVWNETSLLKIDEGYWYPVGKTRGRDWFNNVETLFPSDEEGLLLVGFYRRYGSEPIPTRVTITSNVELLEFKSTRAHSACDTQ